MPLTKIVCTIGPSCDKLPILKKMHKAGMSVLRINLSHSNASEAERLARLARKVSPELGILFDTKGPEMRTGECRQPVELKKGGVVNVKLWDGQCEPGNIHIRGSWKKANLSKGDAILIADGTIELKALSSGKSVKAKTLNEGMLTSNKNVNIPSLAGTLPRYLSKKDKEDIKLAKEIGVEFVAASFIRNGSDVEQIRKVLKASGTILFSKIEHKQAISHLTEIADKSDGIMIARGDLGLSVPLEEVPGLQKSIIQYCNSTAKPVITATQVLDSMTHMPRPTRAETSDVANAIYDGTDAIMLSGETATGSYPVRTVSILSRICSHVEKSIMFNQQSFMAHSTKEAESFVAKSAYIASFDLEADAIVTHTYTGHTARLISQYKPRVPIYAVTSNPRTFRQLAMSFGVKTIMAERRKTTDEELRSSAKLMLDKKILHPNALAVVTIGSHTGTMGKTDILRVGTIKRLSQKRVIGK